MSILTIITVFATMLCMVLNIAVGMLHARLAQMGILESYRRLSIKMINKHLAMTTIPAEQGKILFLKKMYRFLLFSVYFWFLLAFIQIVQWIYHA
jgi:hypothetical protein